MTTPSPYPSPDSRRQQLDHALAALLAGNPDLEAAAVVSFDGLPMAAALPAGMDEARVAAMSAALLSLGERASHGLGRGELSQVFIEGETGTVFLVSAQNEAVLVAVAGRTAKAGLVLYELRLAAAAVATVLRAATDQPAYPQPRDGEPDPLAAGWQAQSQPVAQPPAHPPAPAQPPAAPQPQPAPAWQLPAQVPATHGDWTQYAAPQPARSTGWS